jgi:hypothetical protein
LFEKAFTLIHSNGEPFLAQKSKKVGIFFEKGHKMTDNGIDYKNRV